LVRTLHGWRIRATVANRKEFEGRQLKSKQSNDYNIHDRDLDDLLRIAELQAED
jgi:hypothetical protein